MRKIHPVIEVSQDDTILYCFKMKVRKILEWGVIERFGESEEGVNRQLNQDHALALAAALLGGSAKALWLEPFCVALSGGWEFNEKDSTLIGTNSAYLSIDDGQHRYEGFKTLQPEELDRFEFTVMGHLNLPFETRLRVFRMQGLRRPIDARLNLAQTHRLDAWKKPVDKEAYELVLRLNSDERSPLKGTVQLHESTRRSREDHGGTLNGVNAHGLYATLRTILGVKSPLSELPTSEERADVVINALHVASEVWPNAWRSERHILTTSRGINALLQLFIMGANFRSEIGKDFSPDTIRRGMSLGSTFDWTIGKNKNTGWRDIASRIDQSIQRNSRKRTLTVAVDTPEVNSLGRHAVAK